MQKIKVEKPFRKKYRPVVVYFEALEEIFHLLKKTCEKVELASEDYKFESLQDAKEYFGSRPQFVLKFYGSRPYANVDFSRMDASVHVSAGEKAAQLFHDLDATISPQQRTLSIFYSNWVWLPIMGASFIYGRFSEHVPDQIGMPIACLMLVLFGWFLWISYVQMRRYSVLIFERRNEAKTFLDQNRNAIVMTIITSLISGAIGYGFAKMKDSPPAAVSAPAATTK